MLCSVCSSPEFYEESAVTLHAAMMTSDGTGFVWVTDRLANTSVGYVMVEKLTYLEEHGIVCSIWGDHVAMDARDKLIDRVSAGSVPIHDGEALKIFLRKLGEEIYPQHKGTFVHHMPRGVLLAVLGERPKIYSLSVQWPPIAVEITDQAMYGDDSNPALFFVRRYYARSGKTVPELLAIGIHTIRIGSEMNTKGIEGLDAWVCEKGKLRQLTLIELSPYLKLSTSVDEGIAERLSSLR